MLKTEMLKCGKRRAAGKWASNIKHPTSNTQPN
jgi:hypothetical protein